MRWRRMNRSILTRLFTLLTSKRGMYPDTAVMAMMPIARPKLGELQPGVPLSEPGKTPRNFHISRSHPIFPTVTMLIVFWVRQCFGKHSA